MLGNDVIFQIDEYEVRPMSLTPENIQRFWNEAKKYPTLYGKEIRGNVKDFMELFFTDDEGNTIENRGLFFTINDFTGVFYLTDIRPEEDALAHYTFFDKRHHGREPLVKEMAKWLFNRYKFNRLSVEIPNYASPQARHFVQACGFVFEGKRRKAVMYKGELFDVSLFGLLKSEI